MSALSYLLADPTGNITLLSDTPLPESAQSAAAAALLRHEPTAEQVGFLREGAPGCHLALRMAGGEFCGNAAMSAGALCAARQALGAGESAFYKIAVSGCAAPLDVAITARADGRYDGTVSMPLPCAQSAQRFCWGGGERTLPVVFLPGIAHVICRETPDKDTAAQLLRQGSRALAVKALGLMLLSENDTRLTPLVYVPGVDTLYWEHSCASGTAAVGAYLSGERRAGCTLSLREPGGTLRIAAAWERGRVTALALSGQVRLGAWKRLEEAENHFFSP